MKKDWFILEKGFFHTNKVCNDASVVSVINFLISWVTFPKSVNIAGHLSKAVCQSDDRNYRSSLPTGRIKLPTQAWVDWLPYIWDKPTKVDFCGIERTENPEKKPSESDLDPTYESRIEPGIGNGAETQVMATPLAVWQARKGTPATQARWPLACANPSRPSASPAVFRKFERKW